MFEPLLDGAALVRDPIRSHDWVVHHCGQKRASEELVRQLQSVRRIWSAGGAVLTIWQGRRSRLDDHCVSASMPVAPIALVMPVAQLQP